MSTGLIFAALFSSTSIGTAQTLGPLSGPKGEYVISTRTCADLEAGLGALELIEFDGRSISIGASTCRVAGVSSSGGVFQASCTERGGSLTVTPLRIARPSERALSINGAVYNHCPGK